MTHHSTNVTDDHRLQNKTVFSILSNLNQSSDQTNDTHLQNAVEDNTEVDDIAILKRDPETKQKYINKNVYLKLHRSLSPNRSFVVDKIKEKYEHLNDDLIISDNNELGKDDKLKDTIETIKNKYSPSSLGYTNSKLPIPKPRQRNSIVAAEKVAVKRRKFKRFLLNQDTKPKEKAAINNVENDDGTENEDEDQFLTIVTRSDSEESVFKFQRELSAFVMDKKKRTNSFRKLFTGKFFGGKEKKKIPEQTNSLQGRGAQTSSENNENEDHQLSTHSPYRIAAEGETQNIFTPQHASHFTSSYNREQNNKIPNVYIPMDKPIFQSNDPNIYVHLHNAQKYNDNSSTASASTLESEKADSFQNQVKSQGTNVSDRYYLPISNQTYNYKQDTPPRAMETRQDLKLVNPKALIPVNSKRSLPNPYQNLDVKQNAFPNLSSVSPNLAESNKSRNAVIPPKCFEDEYGTVFDNIDSSSILIKNDTHKNLKSPSLEPSKLKLPTHRDIVPLSPRIRSPIPQEHVSAEKIIATELLKPKRSFTPTGSMVQENHNYVSNLQRQVPVADHRVNINHQYKGPLDKNTIYSKKPPTGTKLTFRRSLDDSKSSNELNSLEEISQPICGLKPKMAASPDVKGYKTDFTQQLPMHSKSYLKEVTLDSDKKSNSTYQNGNVELETEGSSAINQHFTISSKNHLESPRKFYEIGHITKYGSGQEPICQVPVSDMGNMSLTPDDTDNYKNVNMLSNENINRMVNSPIHNKSNSFRASASISPIRPVSAKLLSRPTTPLNSKISDSPQTSPQKDDIRKSVEAYYWNEIRKLKDQENYDLYLYQMHYANIIPPNSSSVESDRLGRSPLVQNNTRRSLSLPRDKRTSNNFLIKEEQSARIPEGRTNSVYLQQIPVQNRFIRNSPQRSTIDGSPRNGTCDGNSIYRPIFKRGSLSTPPKQVVEEQIKRKVSFSKTGQENGHAWPTRNGFTKSPPQRRVEKINGHLIASEARYDYPPESIVQFQQTEPIYSRRNYDLGPSSNENAYGQPYTGNLHNQYGQRQINNAGFIETPYGHQVGNTIILENPCDQRMPNQVIYENRYGYRTSQGEKIPIQNIRQRSQVPEEVLYGQPVDAVRRGITRHGSIQIHEEMYANRNQVPVRRMSQQNNYPSEHVPLVQNSIYGSRLPKKREIILKDDIYGQFGGYVLSELNGNTAVSNATENSLDYNARIREEYLRKNHQKQITVNNMVCDFYGQIHNVDSTRQVQSNGVLMGQLQTNPSGLIMENNLYGQVPNNNFIRNTRLTASANDMYRRAPNSNRQNIDNRIIYGTAYTSNGQSIAPTRPLPPIPPARMKVLSRSSNVSDTESSADANEVQRILNNKTKVKKGIFKK